jgi:hypothetical protein
MYKPVKPVKSVEQAGNCCESARIFPVLLLMTGFLGALTYGCNIQINGFTFTGEKATKSVAGEVVQDVKSIQIDNKHGDIEVVQSDSFGWSWQLTTWAESKEVAESFLDQIEMQVDDDGSQQRWKLIFPEDMSQCSGVESNLVINVPDSVSAVINNRHGETKVNGIRSVTVKSEHGDIDLHSLQEADVDSRHGKLQVVDFGNADIESRHGDLVFSDGSGNLNISTKHGDVAVAGLAGNLNFEGAHGSVNAKLIKGNVEFRNKHGDSSFECAGEKFYGRCSHGDMDIKMANSSVKKVEAKGSHSDIVVWLLEDSAPQVSITANKGNASNEFIPLGRKPEMSVNIETSHGEGHVRKFAVPEESNSRN